MPRLLIVEDTESTAEGSAALFRRDGFEAVHCRSQTKAIELLHAFRPDAALIDVLIPEFEDGQARHQYPDNERGFMLAHILRKWRRDVGIVMISAHIDLAQPYQTLVNEYKTGIGFVGKAGHAQCREAIDAVIRGENPLYESLRHRITPEEQFLAGLHPEARTVVENICVMLQDNPRMLTTTEWKIAKTTKFGLTADGIAGELSKEPGNVRRQLQNVYEKLYITRKELRGLEPRTVNLEPGMVLGWVMKLYELRTAKP